MEKQPLVRRSTGAARALRLACALLTLPLLAGCSSVHTTEGNVDTLSFSPILGLSLLVLAVFFGVAGFFLLVTPPRPGASKGPRKGGGLLLVLFALTAAAVALWRLTWHIDLTPDRIVLRSLFGYAAVPYEEIQDVKVREYQNRWRPGVLWVTIVLVRTDGTEVTLPLTTLSPDHQKFLDSVLADRHGKHVGAGHEAPILPGAGGTETPWLDADMAAKPPVACPVLGDQPIAFCTVCGQKKGLGGGVRIPGFTCSKCQRRIELKYYTPPKLSFRGLSGDKAMVEKDGTTCTSGYGEEAVPGTGILNEGYTDAGRVVMLSKVEKVKFTDYRKTPPEEIVRDVKLQWKLEKK